MSDLVNVPPNVWTDIPAAGLRVFAAGPGSGALVQPLPGGQVRILGAYEIRIQPMSAGTPSPHFTCVDVSHMAEEPGTSWMCTAACPPASGQV